MQASGVTTKISNDNNYVLNNVKKNKKQDNVKKENQNIVSKITKPEFYSQVYGVSPEKAKTMRNMTVATSILSCLIFTTSNVRTALYLFFKKAIERGKLALHIKYKGVNKNSENAVEEIASQIKNNSKDLLKDILKDKKFINIYRKYFAKRAGIVKNELLDKALNGNTEDILKVLIEAHGIGATKLAQIISSDAKIMSQIQKKYPKLAEAIKKTQSQCSFSRTIEEAQEVLTKSFPDKHYVIEKELSAGSIGAAYLVKKPDGTKVVVKMLKKGVDKEELEMEQFLISKLLKSLSSKNLNLEKQNKMIKQIYKDWSKELDFCTELNNNKLLGNNAKRYTVANIIDISKDASCIVMNSARGIQMNKLMEILNDYKANPVGFNTKYAKEIAENPWLKNPQKVINELPNVIAKTFDEQFLFLRKDGNSYMHGDPHMGNFFIHADKNGKLIPEFIDTGNCIVRNSKEIKNDLRFFINYFVGNSKEVAKYFVEQCSYNGKNKEELIEKVTKDIQESIFGRIHNITKFQEIESSINTILNKHGLELSPTKATTIKAELQFFTTISQIGKLSGQGFDIKTLLMDMPHAIWSMIKAGINPYSLVKDAIKFFFKQSQQAVATVTQFLN